MLTVSAAVSLTVSSASPWSTEVLVSASSLGASFDSLPGLCSAGKSLSTVSATGSAVSAVVSSTATASELTGSSGCCSES